MQISFRQIVYRERAFALAFLFANEERKNEKSEKKERCER